MAVHASLKPCVYRGRVGVEKCFCRHKKMPHLVPLKTCQRCPLQAEHAIPELAKTCIYFGAVVETHQVPTCCGRISTVEVRKCGIHEKCVSSQVDSGKLKTSPRPKVCQLCRDRRPPCYDQLAILTPHFNPCGYTRLRETWWEWVETLGPLRDRLTTIELVYDWQDGPETEADIVLHGDERHFLWQKEALLNIGLRSLPPQVKYVAWIDHDAVFENSHWAEHACQLIDNHADVVQLWDRVDFTGPDGEVISSNPSSAMKWVQSKQRSGSPGLAWMASREYLNRSDGLTITDVVGGGDQSDFNRFTDSRMLYVPGAVRHLWHGSRQDRQYVSRIEMLERNQFNPETDVTINSDGLLEWTGANPRLQSAVADYFLARREDS